MPVAATLASRLGRVFRHRNGLGMARRLLAGIRPATKLEWSIGLYSGPSPLRLGPAPAVDNPVLTWRDAHDMQAEFVADPFMLPVDDTWHMFFEVVSTERAKGEIGHAYSRDLRSWRYDGVVLQEPFHLSYPHVFIADGRFYMLPEAHRTGSIRLYEAKEFPTRWRHVATLASGHPFADPSILHHGATWWLFTETSPHGAHDTLRLYHAPGLLGPWREHPESPVVREDPRRARPAGRLIVFDGAPIRYAQDCGAAYGTSVRAFRITRLTPTEYRETLVDVGPFLQGSGRGWNEAGMHHVDAHPHPALGWVACVDGWRRVRMERR